MPKTIRLEHGASNSHLDSFEPSLPRNYPHHQSSCNPVGHPFHSSARNPLPKNAVADCRYVDAFKLLGSRYGKDEIMSQNKHPNIASGLSVAALLAVVGIVFAQGGDDIKPAPPSIGADIPVTYFGPAPSSVQKELVGPVQLLKSGEIDENKGTITLPLYKGQTKDGKSVWYVITDTNDKGNADALGLNYSAKLTYTSVGKGARTAKLEKNGTLTFDSGTVNFAPEHVVKPGPKTNPFPPTEFKPGSVGDANYTPLVRVTNAGGFIYNAPVIAFGVSAEQINFCKKSPDYKLVHDKVISICPEGNGGTVTLALTPGFTWAVRTMRFKA